MRGLPLSGTLASLAVDCHIAGRQTLPPPASAVIGYRRRLAAWTTDAAEESCIPWAFNAEREWRAP